MRVMVLGGYGNFGARICRALAADAAIEVWVAGRDVAAAQQLVASLPANCGAQAVAVDMRSAGFAQVLRQCKVQLLIHTAGPFQGQDYGVARACAEAGVHYIDLADGRRFVCDFAQAVDAAFRAAGCVAVSGASTVPALSSAVVDALCAGWQRIDSIDCCIAPAQTAPRGVATMQAVLGYCGEPLRVWQHGHWQEQTGWAQPQPVAIHGLQPRLGAPCDIPDLELFPTHYQVTDRVEFRAAVEVRWAQKAFALLAALRSRHWIPNPAVFAAWLNAGARCLDPWGSGLGGMVVRVSGLGPEHTPMQRSWHIAADHNHGPEIPCMAAIVLARVMAAGRTWEAGAYPAVGLLALDAFTPEFARWGMTTRIFDEAVGAVSVQPGEKDMYASE